MPKRIQRKRSKGWKRPDNAVNCTRPGRWGNPYPVSIYGLELSLRLFRTTMNGIWSPVPLRGFSDATIKAAYKAHDHFMERHRRDPRGDAKRELRDRDLMCFCPLDQPCHVDVLLEIANV